MFVYFYTSHLEQLVGATSDQQLLLVAAGDNNDFVGIFQFENDIWHCCWFGTCTLTPVDSATLMHTGHGLPCSPCSPQPHLTEICTPLNALSLVRNIQHMSTICMKIMHITHFNTGSLCPRWWCSTHLSWYCTQVVQIHAQIWNVFLIRGLIFGAPRGLGP